MIGGIAAIFWAMRLAAVAAHGTCSRLRFLHLPDGPGGRVALGSALFALTVGLLAVLLRRSEQRIAVDVSDHGAIVLGSATLERLVSDALGVHREIIRVRAEVRSQADGLAAGVWAAARPQVDAAALRAEIDQSVRTALEQATGLPVTTVRIKIKVLRVRELRRYL